MTMDAGEMLSVVNDDSQLLVLLPVLVSSILVHDYVPKAITESVVVPVINDQKDNYRPICLSIIGSKIVDAVLLNRIDAYLQTTPHQFGFKPKHGTGCVCLHLMNY